MKPELLSVKNRYSIAILIFKVLNYDMQNYSVLNLQIDESIILGMGEWHKDIPKSFLWGL